MPLPRLLAATDTVLNKLLRPVPWLFLAACLCASIHFVRIGWDLPLLDLWQFRETQTAFAARDFVEHGFHLDYETPVLGAPWSIPFEFPTYQFVVALVVKISGLPLDQAGRWVSLFFGYAAFALLGVFVWRSSGSRAAGIYSAALALVSPLYIFGVRAVMIESTALFLTLAVLVSVQEFLLRPRLSPAVWTFLAGALAGPTKSTTYSVGLVGVVALLCLHARPAWDRLRQSPRPGRLALIFGAALLGPFLLTVLWTHHTDVVKARNELAAFLSSSALRDWNFGTWTQRMDFKTWDEIVRIVTTDVLGQPLTWVLGLIIVTASGVRRSAAWILGLMFLSGMLVFTNLYLVHNYYHFATGVYLLALLGLGLGALWDRGPTAIRFAAGVVLAPALGGLMLVGYARHTLPRQLATIAPALPLAQTIEHTTAPDSAIIIYGSDWDSTLPYYAHRHALMERGGESPETPRVQRALARLDRPLSGVVFRGLAREDPRYVQRQLIGLHAVGPLVFSDETGDFYLIGPSKTKPVLPSRDWGFDYLNATFESAFDAHPGLFHTRSSMTIHAPGVMKFSRPAQAATLRCCFAMDEASYQRADKSDGVTFAVDFLDEAGKTTRLFERRLTPADVPADRGSQSAEISLPGHQPGTLLLRTEPGPGSAFDWALWHDVQLR